MSPTGSFLDQPIQLPRRSLLGTSGLLLSGAAVLMLAGNDARAAKARRAGADDGEAAAADVAILNSALGAELEAIAAYQVGAESGLLEKPVRALASSSPIRATSCAWHGSTTRSVT